MAKGDWNMALSSRSTTRLRKLYSIVLSRAWASNAHRLKPPTRVLSPFAPPSLEQLEDRLLFSSTLFSVEPQVVTTLTDGANYVLAVDLDGDGYADILSASGYEALTILEGLNDKVQSLDLDTGVKSSLSSKLNSAIHLLVTGTGSQRSFTAMLDNFIRTLNHWYNKGKLTSPAHDDLLDGAERIKFDILRVSHTNTVDLPPSIISIMLNGREEQSASSIESRGLGVQTIQITFSEAVNFTSSAITIQTVTFIDGVETIGITLTPLSITGTSTDTMTITFQSGSVIDTWVKVTLDGSGTITDSDGNALDGEASLTGSGRGYIYDADLDLSSGDGTPGGNAIFYLGSLRADFDSDGDVDGSDFALWQAGYSTPSGASLADGDADGDGDVDGVDFGIWQVNYPSNMRSDILAYFDVSKDTNVNETLSDDSDADNNVQPGKSASHRDNSSTHAKAKHIAKHASKHENKHVPTSTVLDAQVVSQPTASNQPEESVSPPQKVKPSHRAIQDGQTAAASWLYHYGHGQRNAKSIAARSKSKFVASNRTGHLVSAIRVSSRFNTEDETVNIFNLLNLNRP